MKLLSVVTPCFNEEENVGLVYDRVKAVFAALPGYSHEHIFIDNCSTDQTQVVLRRLAADDPHVRVIFNSRNFGHLRSPFHALLQARGEAVISLACDLQDPPELITELIARWEQGFPIVVGVKRTTDESRGMAWLRHHYYRWVNRLAEIELIEDFYGFGMYDRRVVEILRHMGDVYPYMRGMIAEIGFEVARVPFDQPTRTRGLSKNNFYTLYDLAMLGVTSHSKVPLRVSAMAGFALSGISLIVGMGYLAAKLLFWRTFTLGTAPTLIGLFFFSSVQLFFIGVLGEYIGAIHTFVRRRPLVIEKERINFGSRDAASCVPPAGTAVTDTVEGEGPL